MNHILGSYQKLKIDKKWRVILLDHPYLIAIIGQHVYAIPDTCPHQDASLFQGKIDDEIVTCPLHQAKFNLVTGEIDEVSKMLYFDFGPEKITTHKVVIDGDQLMLDL
jgi:nitrite reductase/ring-hydroxylating ferredoxin subunit